MAQVLLVLQQAVYSYMSQHASVVTLMLMEVTPVDKMKVTNWKMGAGMRVVMARTEMLTVLVHQIINICGDS